MYKVKQWKNMRKRIKIRVVKNAKGFIKYTSRPTCVNWKVFEDNLAAIHEMKISLTSNKPTYLGFTVLYVNGKFTIFNINLLSENLMLDYC